MKRDLSLWQLFGFGFSTLGGTLLHFLYDWTNENVFVALFSGVNESTWEHMKLLFFPLFIFAAYESFFFKERGDFWCVKLAGIMTGLFLIPVLFYTYNGVIGKSPDWINIAIFFISAAVAFIIETKLFEKKKLKCRAQRLAFLLICFIAVLFIVFTFAPPALSIFRDPLTGIYGI
ncbi:MAG: hypothetical protein IKU65_03100 [Oscillospiraceae bacterium]|nr:hypothetical protein [Oscillospiraceae bacterium]